MSAYVPVYRVSMVREGSVKMTERPAIHAPEDAARFFHAFFTQHYAGFDREVFVVATTNVRHRILSVETVSIGTLVGTVVSPREIFKLAILRNAAAILVAHTHPSGDPEPSQDDIALTRRLRGAGELLGIEVLDHIVLGEGCHVSLKRRGIL